MGREVAAWLHALRPPSGREGFTAIELLVAAVVGLLVTGAALALCAVGNRAVASLVTSVATWSETRAAAALWAAEWRGVGYDPTGGSGARVERVEAAAMDLSADWNGNGLLVPTDANPNERLSYSVGAGAWRRGVNGGPRLLAAWPDSARFAYRDSQGEELGPAPDPARARIAEVHVRLPRWAACGVDGGAMGCRSTKSVIVHPAGDRPACPARAGAALAVVLWALVALGALALVAALAARVETALAGNYRDHAAALGLAEAGLAEALAREAVDPGASGAARQLEGVLETGSWAARWTPSGGRFAVRASGRSGRAEREVEAWVERAPRPRVVAWREVR